MATVTHSVTTENLSGHPEPVKTTFRYWTAAQPPELSDLNRVFSGGSSDLRPFEAEAHDIRPNKAQFNISDHGFQVLEHESSLLPPHRSETDIPDFQDEQLVKSTYWPEIISVMKDKFNVRAAAVINTTTRDILRRTDVDYKNPRGNGRTSLAPFHIVHGDYTPSGSRAHMRAMLPTFFEENKSLESSPPEDRQQFLKLREDIIAAEDRAVAASSAAGYDDWDGSNYDGPRWAMFSVWRPMSTVERDPLGIMDPKSLFQPNKKGYLDWPRPYSNRPGFKPEYMSANLLPYPPEEGSEGHRWYWMSKQTPSEVYALKLFDSEALKPGSDVVLCAAHSAFPLPGTEELPPRKSVELRVMVIW